MSAYIKRTELTQINNLMLHLKLLEKQEQAKCKTSRRRKIIKIRAKLMKGTKKYKESMKQKAVSLKKINKIDKPLANLTKIRKEKTQIRKIRNKKGNNNHGNLGNHQRLL
jgi:hypothetical protein